MRLRFDVTFQLAKKHIVRIGLAHLQSLVAVIRIAAADNELRRKVFHGLGKRLGITSHMQAIRLHPAGDAAVTGDEGGSTRLLNDRHNEFGPFLKRGVIQVVLRDDDGSHIAATQCALQICRLLLRIARLRDDQDKAATVVNYGHRFVHFRQKTLPARSALVLIR